MVMRKPSDTLDKLPYPTSPPRSQAPAEPSIKSPGHLDVDTSDVPPVPVTKQRNMTYIEDSPYDDHGNPWDQEPISQPPLPPVLQAERAECNFGSAKLKQKHPQPYPPGQNYQVTPRSSLDSQESRNFWEDDDEGREGQQQWAEEPRGGLREPQLMNDKDNPVPKAPEAELATYGASGIRRKPVASPTLDLRPPNHAPPLPPTLPDFASNNPFRRTSSTHEAQQVNPMSSMDAWSEKAEYANGSRSTKGKGKEVLRISTPEQSSGLIVVNQSYRKSSHESLQPNYNLDSEPPHQSQPNEDLILLDSNEYTHPPHPNAAPPPPPPPMPQPQSPFSVPPPLVPVSSQNDQDNPWYAEDYQAQISTLAREDRSEAKSSQYNDSLLDRGQETGVVPLPGKRRFSLQDELSVLPNTTKLDAFAENGENETSAYGDVGPALLSKNKPQNSYQKPEKEATSGNYNDNTFRKDNDDYSRPPEGSPAPEKSPRPNVLTYFDGDGDYFAPPEGPPPGHLASPESSPPIKPPRPAAVSTLASDAQLAKMIEQRNETYQIKHFNWFDHRAGSLRTSSMLTQNKNGPCPLLALVNALILGVREDSQAALDNALRAREQVTLGLIIETLIDELLSANQEGLPDVDELNRFLLVLHAGMNANPRFVEPPTPAPNLMDARNSMLHLPQPKKEERKPGSFEATRDMKLYGAFSVPLVHGWLPTKRDPASAAFSRSAQTYEDAQALQFGEEELEYKLANGGLSDEEQRLWQDITSIKNFLKMYPTQLTPYGLEVIRDWLLPGQFAIMFRNDHFSTIYRHPDTGKLFTLITDAGYAERDEIVWESLTDHSGASEFFSGDFRPVGGSGLDLEVQHNHPSATATDASERRSSSQQLSVPTVSSPLGSPVSPQERQEQHDADFAMALQLQEEEEQHQRRSRNRRQSGTGRSNEGNIPIRLRPPQEARPAIPPRNNRSGPQAVSRPADNDVDDAPPLYEEAVKAKPYNPPVGSQHHPTADPSPRNSTTQLSQTTSATSVERPSGPPPGPRRLQPNQRRKSAYGENSTRYGNGMAGFGPSSPSVGRPSGHAYGVGAGAGQGIYHGRGGQASGSGSGQDRDCVVM